MRRFLCALGIACAFLSLLSGRALAEAPASLPANIAAGQGFDPATFGYYITYDGDAIVLRTSDPRGAIAEYTGRITADGPIRDAALIQPEGDDSATVSDNTVDFRFRTGNGVDGLRFTAHDATAVTFHLRRDGRLIEASHIFLGVAKTTPAGNPFTLVVTPARDAFPTYGYYVTDDNGTFSVRTSDPGGVIAQYTGTITADAPITTLTLIQPESDDSAMATGNTLTFAFHTGDGVDGMRFTASGATTLTFTLFRNGTLIETQHIFVGAGRMNPGANPFSAPTAF